MASLLANSGVVEVAVQIKEPVGWAKIGVYTTTPDREIAGDR